MSTRNGTRNGRVTPKKEPVVVSPPIETYVPPDGKLRVLKVLVQPVLVLDNGDTLREVVHPAIEIKGADWSEWAKTAYCDDALEALRTQLVPLADGVSAP